MQATCRKDKMSKVHSSKTLSIQIDQSAKVTPQKRLPIVTSHSPASLKLPWQWNIHHLKRYTPENKHGTWKYPLGKEETFTNHQFWGSMLMFAVYFLVKMIAMDSFQERLVRDFTDPRPAPWEQQTGRPDAEKSGDQKNGRRQGVPTLQGTKILTDIFPPSRHFWRWCSFSCLIGYVYFPGGQTCDAHLVLQ